MIRLKEGVKTALELQITEKGNPYTGEVSFGIYDTNGDIIFSDEQKITGGVMKLSIPKMFDNEYKFAIETDTGYSNLQDVIVTKSLRKSDKEVSKKIQVDIDNERDEKYDKNVTKNKLLMNEFYMNNGERIRKLETGMTEMTEGRKKGRQEIEEQREKRVGVVEKNIDSLSQRLGNDIKGVENRLISFEKSTDNALGGLEKYIDLSEKTLQIGIEEIGNKVTDLQTRIGDLKKIGDDNVISLSERIKKITESIPIGGVLDYTVDDTKVGKDVLWSSDKIDKRIRGEVARNRTSNQGLHYTTDIDDSQSSSETTYSSAYIDSNFGGGVSDGDKGDITVSGSGTTWTIDDEVVTFAKMQHIATNRILGRSSAGTGDIEALVGGDARSIMGLATSDSPQFTAIELGHATDTTLSRVSAGVIAVEGVTVLLNSDIGTSVQAYDADTAKTDVANTFTQSQTISNASAPKVEVTNGSSRLTMAVSTATNQFFTGTVSGDQVIRTDSDLRMGSIGASKNIEFYAQGLTASAGRMDTNGVWTFDKTLRVVGGLEVNAQTGTTYTLVLTDAGKVVTLSNASAITLTVPLNSSVAFPTGAVINLEQHGAGQVTVAGAGGVTINSKSGNLKLTGQWSGAYLRKTATDTWILIGDLSA